METEAEIAYNKGRQTVIRMLGKYNKNSISSQVYKSILIYKSIS